MENGPDVSIFNLFVSSLNSTYKEGIQPTMECLFFLKMNLIQS